MLIYHRDDLLSSSCFSLILQSWVGLWMGIQSAGELVSETSQLRILHSAEGNHLSPLDSKIACLCQSIAINNNKHIYRKSQVQKPHRWWSQVDWMISHYREWLLSSSFLSWSSIAQSVCEWAFSLLAIWCLRLPIFESYIQQRTRKCLLSIRKPIACARASKLTTANMYVCMYVCMCIALHWIVSYQLIVCMYLCTFVFMYVIYVCIVCNLTKIPPIFVAVVSSLPISYSHFFYITTITIESQG